MGRKAKHATAAAKNNAEKARQQRRYVATKATPTASTTPKHSELETELLDTPGSSRTQKSNTLIHATPEVKPDPLPTAEQEPAVRVLLPLRPAPSPSTELALGSSPLPPPGHNPSTEPYIESELRTQWDRELGCLLDSDQRNSRSGQSYDAYSPKANEPRTALALETRSNNSSEQNDSSSDASEYNFEIRSKENKSETETGSEREPEMPGSSRSSELHQLLYQAFQLTCECSKCSLKTPIILQRLYIV